MLLRVQGMLVDGATPAVAAPGQQDLDDEGLGSIPAGVDLTLECAIVHQDGEALDMTGRTSQLTIKASNSAQQVIAVISGATFGAAADGIVRFAVPATTLRPLLGQYIYCITVTLTAGNVRDEVVPNSNFEVRASAGA